MKKAYLVLAILFLNGFSSFGQVAINTDSSNPDASAMLDVKSAGKGLLIPRMTTAQRTAIVSPAEGLMVYDTDLGSFLYYRSGVWRMTLNSTGGTATQLAYWSSGSTLSSNANLFWDNTNSRLGIGITNPAQQVEITGSLTMPSTSGGSTGVVYKGTLPFIHNFSAAGTTGNNAFFGINAGNFTMSGSGAESSFNAGFGNYTLNKLTTGSYNTAVGIYTLFLNASGNQNTAVGRSALYGNSSGSSNTAIGSSTMYNNTLGGFNIAIGSLALYSNSTSQYNTAMGYMSLYAMSYNNGGSVWNAYNTALGYATLRNLQPTSVSEGTGNTAIGTYAMYDATTGYWNTVIGYNADINPTNISNSVAVGYNTTATASNQVRLGNASIDQFFCQGAYAAATASSPNMVVSSTGQIGRSTLPVPTGTGVINRVAFWSGTTLLSSNANLYWDNANSRLGIGLTNPVQQLEMTGSLTLPATTSASTGVIYKGTAAFLHNFTNPANSGGNTFAGISAGNFTMGGGTASSGSFNTGVGQSSLAALTTGMENTAVGYESLTANTNGWANTAVGYRSLDANIGGTSNTAVGDGSLGSNTDGNDNTAIGHGTLGSNLSGDENTAVGDYALASQSSGDYNTAIGRFAMFWLTTGSNNTVLGAHAGEGDNTSCTYQNNTMIGAATGANLTSGSANLLLGNGTGSQLTSGSNNVLIGYDVEATSATSSYQMVIGASDLLFGDLVNKRIGIGSTTPEGQLQLQNAGDVLMVIKADSDNSGEDDNPRLELRQDGTLTVGALGYEGTAGQTYTGTTDNAMYLVNQYASSLLLGSNNTVQVAIESGGNVGIGVTDPAYKVQIGGTVAPDITNRDFGTSSLRWDIFANSLNSNADVVFSALGTGTGTDLIVDGSGNVLKKSSSSRYKTDFSDLEINSSDIYNLNPVSFTWINQGIRDFGFVAEEVAEEVPSLVNYDDQGRAESVKYDQLSVLLLEELKKQKEEIERLKQRIQELEDR